MCRRSRYVLRTKNLHILLHYTQTHHQITSVIVLFPSLRSFRVHVSLYARLEWDTIVLWTTRSKQCDIIHFSGLPFAQRWMPLNDEINWIELRCRVCCVRETDFDAFWNSFLVIADSSRIFFYGFIVSQLVRIWKFSMSLFLHTH